MHTILGDITVYTYQYLITHYTSTMPLAKSLSGFTQLCKTRYANLGYIQYGHVREMCSTF